MVNKTDGELLEILRGPNQILRDKALSEVYRRTYSTIERMITSNSGSIADAEDIFHDGLISFYKQAQNGLTLTCALKTYIFSICRNLWLKRLRKSGRSDRLENQHNEIVEMDNDPEEFLIVDECATLVAENLKALGGDCQKIIVYSYFDQFKADEIAKLMDYATPQVARNKKSSCLKRFREQVLEKGKSGGSLRQCLEAYL